MGLRLGERGGGGRGRGWPRVGHRANNNNNNNNQSMRFFFGPINAEVGDGDRGCLEYATLGVFNLIGWLARVRYRRRSLIPLSSPPSRLVDVAAVGIGRRTGSGIGRRFRHALHRGLLDLVRRCLPLS